MPPKKTAKKKTKTKTKTKAKVSKAKTKAKKTKSKVSKTKAKVSKTKTKAKVSKTKTKAKKAASGKRRRKNATPEALRPDSDGTFQRDPRKHPHGLNLDGVAIDRASIQARAQAKRKLKADIPLSTSVRAAEDARRSVWAISSEKTTLMFEAAEDLDRERRARHEEVLVEESTPPSTATRRSARDAFGFFRAELARPEAEDDPHSLWRLAHQRQRHELLAGIDPEALDTFEERVGAKLPPSFYDFSLEWGGGQLYVQDHAQIRILPATRILKEITGALCNRMVRPLLPIVDLGLGDYLALDMSRSNRSRENPVWWWYAGEREKKIADSFGQWLKKLVDVGGAHYWWR